MSTEFPFGTAPVSSYDRLQTAIDRRLTECIELLAMVRRLSFLLNSARLLIADPAMRALAEGAVRDAEQLLSKVAK